MVLAAGRGERMRPLTDACPKPLLEVGGKPLIVWQIERLVAGGFAEIVINVSYRAEQMMAALGDGTRFGARIAYSSEAEPLESAGGIAQALPLLGEQPVAVVAADVYTEFDYARLLPWAAMLSRPRPGDSDLRAHLVLVPNPPFRPRGDYAVVRPPEDDRPVRVRTEGEPRFAWSGIGVFAIDLLREIPVGQKIPLLPFFVDWMRRGVVGGELYSGVWDNLGTPAQLEALDRALAAQAAPAPLERGAR
jgi:MurNAc alpha-1-phosphate uridylyltransferase